MKIQPTAQSFIEWAALKSGLAPGPVALGHFGYMASRFLMEALDKGVFEAIGKKTIALHDIAAAIHIHPSALEKLLRLLASMGLVKTVKNDFALSNDAKKWLLQSSPHSLYWLLMFDLKVCTKWMDHIPEYLTSAKGIQYHQTFTQEEWYYYQKAMAALARNAAREIVRRVPSFDHPATMLDIGGAHGLYAEAFCKKYPSLQATILDLPPAIAQVQKINGKSNERITWTAGDILDTNIGQQQYDFVLMASVAHHLTEAQNNEVVQKVFDALKPGGYFTIMEVLRPGPISKHENMLAAIGDIFFALSSTSGTWSMKQIRSWMQNAGLKVVKRSSFLFIPGYIAITAKKP